MHVPCADLYFERLPFRPQDGGVKRLVIVELRHGDVVLEPTVQRGPLPVNHTKGRIAGGLIGHDDSNPDEVMNLIKALALHHFAIN